MKKKITNHSSISEESRYGVRAEIEHQFVNSLLTINGGAALASLAFIQSVWEKSISLAQIALIGLIVFGIGVFFGVLVNYFRYLVNTSRSKGKERQYWIFLRLSRASRILSLLCFLSGIFYMGFWGLNQIEHLNDLQKVSQVAKCSC